MWRIFSHRIARELNRAWKASIRLDSPDSREICLHRCAATSEWKYLQQRLKLDESFASMRYAMISSQISKGANNSPFIGSFCGTDDCIAISHATLKNSHGKLEVARGVRHKNGGEQPIHQVRPSDDGINTFIHRMGNNQFAGDRHRDSRCGDNP